VLVKDRVDDIRPREFVVGVVSVHSHWEPSRPLRDADGVGAWGKGSPPPRLQPDGSAKVCRGGALRRASGPPSFRTIE